jgi:hypothetical protein
MAVSAGFPVLALSKYATLYYWAINAPYSTLLYLNCSCVLISLGVMSYVALLKTWLRATDGMSNQVVCSQHVNTYRNNFLYELHTKIKKKTH